MKSLGGGFGALLGLSPEKKRQQQFATLVSKSEKTESDIEFMIKYLESVCKASEVKQLRDTLDEAEFNKVLRGLKVSNLKPEDPQSLDYVKFSEIDLTIVIQGTLALEEQGETKSVREYGVGSVIYCKEGEEISIGSDDKKYRLVCKTAASQSVLIQRTELDAIIKTSEENFLTEYKDKLACLCRVFPSLAKASLSEQRVKSRKFKVFPHSKAGAVITTITSGSNDMFVIAKGTVLIWMPKTRVNQDYKEEFIIIGQLKADSFFNEQSCLFAKECNYGAMVLSEDCQIYAIKREDIGEVCEGVAQENLKAMSEIRDRMYKGHQKRYGGLSSDDLYGKQKALCKNLEIDFDHVKKLFDQSSKNQKIVTVNLIDSKAFNQNLEKFNKLAQVSGFKSTEMQGDKELIALTVTPRLVSRTNGVNEMTPAQQLQLISLRQSGKGLREGTQQKVNFKMSEMDETILEKEKQEVQMNLASGFLVRKNIQQFPGDPKPPKKTTEETKEESATADNSSSAPTTSITSAIPTTMKSLHQKMDSSNDLLLKKIGQVSSQVTGVSSSTTSEFSLKSSIKPMNSVFLNIEKAEIQNQQLAAAPIKKPDDKFAAQRKKLMNFGI